jgi:hypothetical protein
MYDHSAPGKPALRQLEVGMRKGDISIRRTSSPVTNNASGVFGQRWGVAPSSSALFTSFPQSSILELVETKFALVTIERRAPFPDAAVLTTISFFAIIVVVIVRVCSQTIPWKDSETGVMFLSSLYSRD